MTFQKQILILFFLTLSTFLSAQNFEDNWKEHFAYLDINSFAQSDSKIYAAAENAIFSYDKFTNQISTITTIQGLSGDNISTIKYITSKNKLYIGYETGLIQIYDEIDNSTFSVVDILDKPTISPEKKVINDIYLHNDRVYISTDYGISVFFIDAEEFGDTYFIGVGNTQIKVNQTTVFGNYIYAATEVNFRRGLLSNQNLVDANQWETGNLGGNWINIVSTDESLYAVKAKRVYRINDLASSSVLVMPGLILDMTTNQNNLVVTQKNRVRVFREDLSIVNNYLSNNYNGTIFTKAILSNEEKLFIGTIKHPTNGKPGYGVLQSDFLDPENYSEIHPESPFLNRFFKIEAKNGHLWGTHGGHSISYNFSGGIRRTGISHLINDEWKNIRYDSIKAVVSSPPPEYLSYISINPFNANRIMLSSFWFGVIEIEGTEILEKYNSLNSTLLPLFGAVHYCLPSIYDDNGVFWVLNARVSESLNKFQDGQWSSVNLDNVINPPNSNLGFGEIAIDNNGNLFLGSHGYGLISYSPGNGANTFNNVSGTENNIPANSVRTVKVDNNNQVWFGTVKGLRVVYNPDEFVNGNAVAEEIIILDDGEASELLFQQFITDIEIDGSNNKWIGTLDNGLFYFSPDGQRTIYHFTKDNSPLPSNDVLDVAIDDASGRLYVATEKGLVSFGASATKPSATLDDAYVYPNPVRPGFNIVEEKVKIIGLTENMNIKIVDIEGNLVMEAETKRNGKFNGFDLEIDGGTALWNGKNLSGNVVASGVYVVLLNDLETFETKVLKIMLVR